MPMVNSGLKGLKEKCIPHRNCVLFSHLTPPMWGHIYPGLNCPSHDVTVRDYYLISGSVYCNLPLVWTPEAKGESEC